MAGALDVISSNPLMTGLGYSDLRLPIPLWAFATGHARGALAATANLATDLLLIRGETFPGSGGRG